ncbi:Cytochrome P450 family 71 protein [Rhynchospora pubera]|uniref:Cytochrome P450 family 71 protein n=1 Tax=Rhynchospora pubera TaxID=906938 RepID=A0AAV8CNA6_9POAL|nr:Cytochrome P450 family 71 protein [Rhynchospora pubera]
MTRSKSKLPPGPWTLPFIGSLHHLATAHLPHHALRELAQFHGPVMLLRAGEIDLVVLSSREAAKEVLKSQDAKLANRPAMIAANLLGYGCTDIVFSNGTYWRQLRRICTTELFSSKQVKSFSSIRREEINSLLKSFTSFPDESPVNLSEMTSELSNHIIIRAAFGGKFKDKGPLLEIMSGVLESFSGFNLSDLFPSLSWLDFNMRRRFVRLHSKLDLVLEEILKEHLIKQKQQQNQKGDEVVEYDLVDVLINVKENGDLEEPITMDTIKSVILDVLFAGTESSATTITWAMAELIRHPEVMAKAQAELRKAATINEKSLDYLKFVIKETLRMHPPGPLLVPRVCHESCQILGYTIPSGSRIIVNAWALGRNPNYWDDPEEFKPERFETSAIDFKGHDFEFLPFGAGRRICPGLEFSVTLVEEALAKILLHFDWELSNGMKPNDLDMTETFGITAAKKVPLLLIPTLRVPLPDC